MTLRTRLVLTTLAAAMPLLIAVFVGYRMITERNIDDRVAALVQDRKGRFEPVAGSVLGIGQQWQEEQGEYKNFSHGIPLLISV